ncbi:MAG TPA: indolepyruvate ferredoxin oxidoreductase family protein, partial [Nevskiaceae bacterium]|nr:indolepyruvate ferredoxin oxidoreductase family protein [Nevskiaceae bacterium]
RSARASTIRSPEARLAYYCSGCPHSTSTHIPEGSRALAGIGCHSMAMWMPERRTGALSHMGAEGVQWIGQAPYTSEPHVFTNMGDGTYFHSGTLAIRAAVAAGVNITYKILFNDAVAMTGGQPVDGVLTVPQVVRQLQAERVRRIVVVSDDIEKYRVPSAETLPPGTEVRHRDDLDAVQRELRAAEGCTAIVYDQTCAAEKRRRRKKIVDGKPLLEDPPKRLFINEAVCEGCGDCSVQSSCLSIEPLETPFGRKRTINQSTCNKDYSCVKGFCPSFVTVKGGKLRKPAPAASLGEAPAVPEPRLPAVEGIYNVLVAGIGGTGVVTIGQLMGMAAHLEGKPVSTMDITGVSQKGGAVTSHVKIGSRGTRMTAARVALGSADALIGCDIVVSAGEEVLGKASADRTQAVINSTLIPTATFVTQRDWTYPVRSSEAAVQAAVRSDGASFVNAGALALRLLGDSIYSNPFMLGFAWQKGMIPLSGAALRRAIELNGVAIEQNRRAFEWGRYAAHDPEGLRERLAPTAVAVAAAEPSLEDLVRLRAEHLGAYGNAQYAERYRALVQRVESAEASLGAGRDLSTRVAAAYAKLLAYKDEYEVARLYSTPAFEKRLAETFEGDYAIEFNLAPPIFSKRNARGELVKRPYGGWMKVAFKMLARLKFLRGTMLDPFGYTAERRIERRLVARYEAIVEEVLRDLAAHNHAVAIELAGVPDQIRGFGHVKAASIGKAERRWDELLAMFRRADADAALAAEQAQRVQVKSFRMF